LKVWAEALIERRPSGDITKGFWGAEENEKRGRKHQATNHGRAPAKKGKNYRRKC